MYTQNSQFKGNTFVLLIGIYILVLHIKRNIFVLHIKRNILVLHIQRNIFVLHIQRNTFVLLIGIHSVTLEHHRILLLLCRKAQKKSPLRDSFSNVTYTQLNILTLNFFHLTHFVSHITTSKSEHPIAEYTRYDGPEEDADFRHFLSLSRWERQK